MSLHETVLVQVYNLYTEEHYKSNLDDVLKSKYKDGKQLYQAKCRLKKILNEKGFFTIELDNTYCIVFKYPLDDLSLLNSVKVNTCRYIIDPLRGNVITEKITNIMQYNLPNIKDKYKALSSRLFSVRSLNFKITLLDYLEIIAEMINTVRCSRNSNIYVLYSEKDNTPIISLNNNELQENILKHTSMPKYRMISNFNDIINIVKNNKDKLESGDDSSPHGFYADEGKNEKWYIVDYYTYLRMPAYNEYKNYIQSGCNGQFTSNRFLLVEGVIDTEIKKAEFKPEYDIQFTDTSDKATPSKVLESHFGVCITPMTKEQSDTLDHLANINARDEDDSVKNNVISIPNNGEKVNLTISIGNNINITINIG